MGKKQRYRTKEAREIADQVKAAGGAVELNGRGHLKVTGPLGSIVIGSLIDGAGAHDQVRGRLARIGITIGRRGSGHAKAAG